DVDLKPVAEGQTIKLFWRGKLIFVRHRTKKEIDEAQKVNVAQLPDPASDASRVKAGKEQYLIVYGSCTHLGCVPLGEAGDYHGWFCPCHGSHYDTSGRIRKGPAPLNLPVPPYAFTNDTAIRIG
ncbi:MAG: ubiquinol-cytochrome c reductase iron-sulfur subunit, partial [Beijerinckiaceae bacterium]